VSAISHFEDRYRATGFVARVRDAERTAGCQDSAVEMATISIAFTQVIEALKEGLLPPATSI
jgi:hypothetical protein